MSNQILGHCGGTGASGRIVPLVTLRTERDGRWRTRARPSRRADQLASFLDVAGAEAIGEEPVIANADEPGGDHVQDVQEEASQELDGVESHGLLRVVVGIVTPGEGDVLAVEGDRKSVV